MTLDLRFPTMGTQAHVLVQGDQGRHAALAIERIAELERRWSRFRDDSEVSRLNRAPGRDVPVSPDTIELLERSCEAWELTDGRFDPSLHAAIVALGYDRDLAELARGPGTDAGAVAAIPRRGTGLDLHPDRAAGTARVGAHGVDSGGLGKGLAADLIVAELLDDGAAGALVNLGGDLRCAGAAPAGGWTVNLDDPFHRPAAPLARLTIDDGAVATSSPLARRWWQGDRERHHLIDPATGQPAVSDIAAVTVVCREGWRAEALAKAAFLAGADDALDVLDAHGATGLVTATDGRIGVGPRLRGRLQLRDDLRRPRRSSTRRGASRRTTEPHITAELAAGGRSARVRIPAGPPE